ncbi:phage tail tip lysozyme [Clostridium butyricum]|uniref:phage tail tip lysozyme n=1 Tax=Clostridium butyricum TaxID=1492 RepID=UPI0012B72A87|nr:phage tail tip lysozyme [Clostridium butyricum]
MIIEEEVWKFFRSKGLTEKSVAAIMGNIYQESKFDPNLQEVGGDSWGLFQCRGDRLSKLKSYGTDLTHQLEFAWSELAGQNLSETGAEFQWIQNNSLMHSDFMAGNGSIADLTEAFCTNWERAGKPKMEVRKQHAQEYFNQFTGASGGYTGSSTNGDRIDSASEDDIYNNKSYRALDKEGIYRIYKLEFSGDTRGNDWYVTVNAVSQAGGVLPSINK